MCTKTVCEPILSYEQRLRCIMNVILGHIVCWCVLMNVLVRVVYIFTYVNICVYERVNKELPLKY